MSSSETAEILKYPPPRDSDGDQEAAAMEDLNGPALDLKLCNDRDGGKQQSSSAASQSSNEAEAAAEGGKNYCCKYCNKRFSNSQALGGHQNAHKRERAVAKKEKGFQEAARAAIESRLYPFSTISAYNSRYGIGAASFSSPGLGVQRQSFIHKPFTSGGYRAGTSNTGSGPWSGYSDYDVRRFAAFANRPAPNHKYGIQIKSPNMVGSYWGRDGMSGGGYQPQPPQARTLINVGGYQPPAPPSRAFNVCGSTANLHSFGWSSPGGGASRPADHCASGGSLLQLQRVLQKEAEVGRVPAVEKQTSRQALDLTLKL